MFAVVLVALLLALYLVALAALYIGQRRLQYFPNAREVAPAAVGLPNAERLHLKTADGETLLAWFVAPAPGRPLILYFHGNAGGLDLRALRFAAFAAAGDGVLATEYRGYGGSTGSPSEAGLLNDGEAAWEEAARRGFAANRIVVMGESLGTGVAVALAARHDPGALVLDSPYSSTVDVAASLFPMFPVRALMRDTFRSDLRIAKARAPLLIVHGARDMTIPIRFARRLFELAPQPKEFFEVPGAGHLALGYRIPETLAWIDRAIR
jgi:hypothetical protein